MMKRFMLVLLIVFCVSVPSFAQVWDYVMTGDALPDGFGRFDVFMNWDEKSFADTTADAMNGVWTIATDPEDSTNQMLQCIDLYDLGEDVSQAIMIGDRLPEDVTYDKMTILFRARCVKPEEIPDSLEVDFEKSRRYLGWNIWVGGQFFQIQYETGERDPDQQYPAWIRAARMWADSARTQNDVVDKYSWNTFRFTAEVDDAQMGLHVKGWLNEDPEPIVDGYYTESYNAEATETAFYYGDDRTSGWKVDENGVTDGGAKAWFDWVAVAYGETLEPGTPLPLNVDVDGPDGNFVANEGWIWMFDGSKNLIEGATNTYGRLSITPDWPTWEDGPTWDGNFLNYYDNPHVFELLYNSIYSNIEDPDIPGNMLYQAWDDNDYELCTCNFGPYAEGESVPGKGTVIWRARNYTEDEGLRGRRGWAATVDVPGFEWGDIKCPTGYWGDHGERPCTIEFMHNSTNKTGRYAYTEDGEGNKVPNEWLASIGGTLNTFEWHTYRMTWDRDLPDSVCCKLYVDENPIPAFENQPWPKDPAPQIFGFLMGDQRQEGLEYDDSGTAKGKTTHVWDYVGINFGTAYGPGEGLDGLPEDWVVEKVETAVETNSNAVVKAFSLAQNYPNPFNPTTTIQFSIVKNTQVELAIYNVLGSRIKTLVNSKLNSGVHTVQWNGMNEAGDKVGTGIYYYTIKVNDGSKLTRKMLLMK